MFLYYKKDLHCFLTQHAPSCIILSDFFMFGMYYVFWFLFHHWPWSLSTNRNSPLLFCKKPVLLSIYRTELSEFSEFFFCKTFCAVNLYMVYISDFWSKVCNRRRRRKKSRFVVHCYMHWWIVGDSSCFSFHRGASGGRLVKHLISGVVQSHGNQAVKATR